MRDTVAAWRSDHPERAAEAGRADGADGADGDVATNHAGAGGSLTFAEWAPVWRAEATTHLRPSSQARADTALKTLVAEFGGDRLDSITTADVRRWMARRVSEGAAPSGVTRLLRVLGACLQVAAEDGLIASNPARGIRPPAQLRHEQRYLTPAEVARLADAIDPRYRGLVYLGAYGGLRIGEMAGLRVGRVDLQRGQVQVVEQIVEVAGRQHAGPPKTAAGRRSVPIPRFVADALAPHCQDKLPEAFVFTAPEGGPIRRTIWAARFFRPAVEAAGLAPLRVHDLRHTAVALWIHAGASPLEVTRRAGHSSSAFVLDRYGHLYGEGYQRTTDALDQLARAATERRSGSGYLDSPGHSHG